MALTYITGFESGSLFGEPRLSATNSSANIATVVGSVAIESTIVRTGGFSLKLTPASGANGYWDAQSAGGLTNRFLRFYLRVTTLPGTARQIWGLAPGGGVASITLNPSGTLALSDGGFTITTTDALTDTSRWYRIDADMSTTTWQFAIDGNTVTNGSSFSAALTMSGRFGATDTVAATYTAYVDDVAYGTSTIGSGKCALLKPVSDNSRGTWTGGAGGTTNTFDAIDNQPPVGVAVGSATNTSQIKSLATSFPANYDVNLTSYTTAGVAAADTINAVIPWCITGEDPATGTKAGSIAIVSNPAVGAATFNFGNDLGAAGTFPGNNWVSMRAAISTSPSVTLGTSPVARVVVTSGTTAARAAFVCFLGMYVDYTPAVVVTYVPRSPGVDSGFGHF